MAYDLIQAQGACYKYNTRVSPQQGQEGEKESSGKSNGYWSSWLPKFKSLFYGDQFVAAKGKEEQKKWA